MTRFDLTTENGVLAFLDDRFPEYAGSRAIKIAGGNTNFTFRIYLKKQIVREGLSYKTVFLKHATDYSASNANFPLPKERQARSPRPYMRAINVSSRCMKSRDSATRTNLRLIS